MLNEQVSRFARWVSGCVGHWLAFPIVLVLSVIWTLYGPGTDLENYAISIYTVLLLHLLQHTQNHNDRALHLKLDELIGAQANARNELKGVEEQSEEVLERQRKGDSDDHAHG